MLNLDATLLRLRSSWNRHGGVLGRWWFDRGHTTHWPLVVQVLEAQRWFTLL